jgi:hypothetical protein
VSKALDTLQPYADEIKRSDGDVSDITRSSLVLATLLMGKEIPEAWWAQSKKDSRTFTWVTAMPRALHPGDVVRVKTDAYVPNHPLHAHNGREGVVTAIRGGIVVSYAKSAGLGTRHEHIRLEKQVPVQPKVVKGGEG